MRKIILPLIASLAFATPALANDTRVEVRGGAIWSNGKIGRASCRERV